MTTSVSQIIWRRIQRDKKEQFSLRIIVQLIPSEQSTSTHQFGITDLEENLEGTAILRIVVFC